jgi:NhaC family Na+:H+ antiporter
MENIVLLSFAAVLLIFLLNGWPLLLALLIGLMIFSAYSLKRGFTVMETLGMWRDGVMTAKNILLTFCLIGFLTGLWRAGGTIPAIVYYASGLIRPSLIIFLTFLLNCLLSFLMGTSFGTAATMGLICMTIAKTMGVSPAITGGAVLSGIYFGDRCSPVSTSALLTAEITGTNLYDNIKRMMKSAAVPVLVCCVIYFFIASGGEGDTSSLSVQQLFASHFDVSWPMLIPAAGILVLALFRVPVKKTLSVSIFLSIICAAVFQKMSASEIVRTMLFGFQTNQPELRSMLAGGGLVSMFRTGAIVMTGACYSGIFDKTGLLRNLQGVFENIGRKFTPAVGICGAGIMSSMIACNQTLAIMMTKSLCEHMPISKEKLALTLEDTVVLIAGLIPWSIACAAPLAFIEAPNSSILYASYLYLLPIWCMLTSLWEKKHADGVNRSN